MPELPEVETIKNDLLPLLVGHHFTGVTLHWPRAVLTPSPEEFRQQLKGQGIAGLGRRGKYLIFHLSSGKSLILHLRMSGSLILKPTSTEPVRYSRSIFTLDNGNELHFVNPRKLGVMWLVADEQEVVRKLGPEPLDPSFTPELLGELLHRRKAPIKALLCDQKFIAGIGNMYADEALFASQIHPLERGGDLSKEEITRLHCSIGDVLRSAITSAGASTSNYRRPDGTPGEAQLSFKVAHHGGKPCPACGTPIQRIPIRNRGSYFCPNCQRKK